VQARLRAPCQSCPGCCARRAAGLLQPEAGLPARTRAALARVACQRLHVYAQWRRCDLAGQTKRHTVAALRGCSGRAQGVCSALSTPGFAWGACGGTGVPAGQEFSSKASASSMRSQRAYEGERQVVQLLPPAPLRFKSPRVGSSQV